jgi:hypothetical protein
MNKKAFIFLFLITILVSGCAASRISDIATEENIGKTVAVFGKVASSIKLGELSGYQLEDSAGDKIFVSTDSLPKDGSSITARGTLIKDILFGYYIKQ